MRAAGSSAGWRATAIGMVGPSGRARSPAGRRACRTADRRCRGTRPSGVTGGWVVEVVVVVRRADGGVVLAPADRRTASPGPLHPAATRAAASTTRSTQCSAASSPGPALHVLFPGMGHRSPACTTRGRAGGHGQPWSRRRFRPGGVRAPAGQGRGASAGGLRPARPAGPGSSPGRSGPPRPGAAAPRARSASGAGSTMPSAGAASCCTTGPSPAGAPTSTTSWWCRRGSGWSTPSTTGARWSVGSSAGWFVARPRLCRGGPRPERAWWLRRAGSRRWWPRRSASAGTRRRSARPRRAVLHRRGAPALHPTLPPRRRVGDVAPGPRPDVGRARAARSRRTRHVGRPARPGLPALRA